MSSYLLLESACLYRKLSDLLTNIVFLVSKKTYIIQQ